MLTTSKIKSSKHCETLAIIFVHLLRLPAIGRLQNLRNIPIYLQIFPDISQSHVHKANHMNRVSRINGEYEAHYTKKPP